MSDAADAGGAPDKRLFPANDIPTYFVDGVLNFQPGPEVVRFYLGRIHPAMDGSPQNESAPVGQIVMALTNFLQTAAFFEHVVELLIRDNTVSSDQVEALRASYRDSRSVS